MSIHALGLRTVIYPAPDLAAAKAWWSGLLGFDPYFDEPYYVGFDVAGYELGLLPDADPEVAAIAYWGVPDVAAAMRAALDAGAEVRQESSDVGGGITTGSVRTPHGSIVGFIDNPHFAPRTAAIGDRPDVNAMLEQQGSFEE